MADGTRLTASSLQGWIPRILILFVAPKAGIEPATDSLTVRWSTADLLGYQKEKWCRHEDSNPGHPDYKSGALPSEL